MSSQINSSSGTTTAPAVVIPKIQTLNYVNLLAYVSNFLVVFGATRAGLPDNATLSNKYQTLVTPAPYAFAIWGIIFTSELVWAVAQFLPKYRSHELVVKGVGYHFAMASLAQCAWTIVFGLERIGLSLVFMVGILIQLLSVLANTSSVKSKTTTSEYWLLKFPFEIHASWIMAATLVNVNVLFVAYEASPTAQTVVGWVSLAILCGVGLYALVERPNRSRVWVVPCVLAWASFAISRELSEPREMIQTSFSEATIRHTQIASVVAALLLVLAIAIQLLRIRFFPKEGGDILESEDDRGGDGSEQQYMSLN